MGNSGAKPKQEITDIDKSILSLKTQRRRLEDHRTRVITQIDNERDVARQLIAGQQPDRASLALKRKRLHENALKKVDAWLLNVESILLDVELTKDQVRVFNALKQGTEAQKMLQKEMSLEDVEKLMEDTAEAREYQDQLELMLNQSLTGQDQIDVEEELKVMEQEVAERLRDQLPTVPTTTTSVKKQKEEELVFPSVPTHVPSTAKEQEQVAPLLAG